jgi:GntP family gluconate:H+ symporter
MPLQLPAAVEAWTGHDTQLLVVAALGIALIVVLIAKFKLHPFLALVLGSAFVGLASGVELAKIISNFEDGVGGVLKEVGLLIALGAMLGKLLADSGGANRVVDTLLSKATDNKSAGTKTVWAITLVAVIIGLPMFFEIGLVLLLPVIVLVTQRSKMPLMRIAIPALAGLSVLHGLVPPHPGPLIAISAVKAPRWPWVSSSPFQPSSSAGRCFRGWPQNGYRWALPPSPAASIPSTARTWKASSASRASLSHC